MSNIAVGQVWQRSRAKGSNLLVLLAIADLTDDDGNGFWQSHRRLADKSRLADRSLRYIIAKLKRDREIAERPNKQRLQPKGSQGYIPDRFYDVRCVCDWPTYAAEGAAKFAGVVNRGQRKTLPVLVAESGRSARQDLAVANKEDLSVDLSVDLPAPQTARRRGLHPVLPKLEGPIGASWWQLEKLTNLALDEGGFTTYADLSEDVKQRAGRIGLVCDPELLTRSLYTVVTERGFDRRVIRSAP